VSDCLREWQTGGLRRTHEDRPFADVIVSERTPRREREIAGHPSLKPQSILRPIVHAALPLGVGIIADPFAGSGSTVAAAEAAGVPCIGVENNADYYRMSKRAIPQLAALTIRIPTETEGHDKPAPPDFGRTPAEGAGRQAVRLDSPTGGGVFLI
jgi:site-specific DNA-methyltransferase (adenine-specific)